MAEQNIIDVSFDIPKFDLQIEHILTQLKAGYDLMEKIGNTAIKPGSVGGFTELKGAIDQVNKLSDAHNKLTLEQKEAERQARALAQAQAKGTALTQANAVEVQKQLLLNKEQTKANKEVAQSVLGMVDEYGKLKKEYEAAANAAKNLSTVALKTGDSADIQAAQEATLKAKGLHDSLLTIEQGVGQSQRNVGNYNRCLKSSFRGIGGSKSAIRRIK